MSVQALTAVFELPGWAVSPSERLVLLSVANHANRYGADSWPGWDTIADETGLSRATVARALGSLGRRGFVTVDRRRVRNAQGRFEVSVYTLHIPGLPEPRSHGETTSTSHGETTSRSHGETGPGLKPGLIDDDSNLSNQRNLPAPETGPVDNSNAVVDCAEGHHDFASVGSEAWCKVCRMRVASELAELSA